MPRWMISCKDYSELVSECMDRPLSLWERISIKLHQMICPPCQVVDKQLNTIREACRWAPPEDKEIETGPQILPDEAKEKIRSALKNLSK